MARRGWPVCLWVAAMMDCHMLGKRCPPLMLAEGLDPLEHSGLDHAETILGLDPLAPLAGMPFSRMFQEPGSFKFWIC